ncbi:hypothetical protein RAZWK3B_14843 [Roseobacter sp. AzwK-3b]|uniref:helix-turn-helix domain-containing protein n=1 Tax=Roseobacter sp. AzwK-3b TaxID=351016 RepID=UPI0001568B06|nr:helix-turn-helix domain-containing protein [Roseobacter sp. AzwK-3b]EDM70684.1 hypothetical protein RAZWK3B_14843 [Roseobacter sp. AzwK-3b]
MSITALQNAFDAIRQHKMSNSAKLVLLCLANRHNQETGRCDPSIPTIATDMKISERAARDGLRELERLGLVKTIRRTVRTGLGKRNMSNRYNLRGGAKYAGGMGQNLPGKQEYKRTSVFDDLAMLLESQPKADFGEAGRINSKPWPSASAGFAEKGSEGCHVAPFLSPRGNLGDGTAPDQEQPNSPEEE